jgi:hypothetical protein
MVKIAMGMSLNIKPTDVVPVCNKAWPQSFARVEPNKRAIARRGWDPLNRGLLKHPDVLKTKVTQEALPVPTAVTNSATVPTEAFAVPDSATVFSDLSNTVSTSPKSKSLPKSLNLTTGYAGEFVTGMLQYAIKNEKNAENLNKRYKDGRTLKESLSQQENKRFSAGSLFKANRVAIDSELLDHMEEKEKEAVRIKHVSISKHTNEFLANKKRAEEILASSKKPEAMVNSELKALVKWKKRKGDDAIPSTKPLLMQRFSETMERIDQTLAKYLEENGLAQYLEENGLQHQPGWV